tara:strand:+ start:87 stop:326 length:240 start_codon:yes stop_codon:yes gene_type:complete
MDAKEFLKELKVPKRWRGEDEIGDWLYYEKGVIEAMEQYHQSKVNNVVLDDVIKCPMCGEYGEKGLDNRYYCNNCERDY